MNALVASSIKGVVEGNVDAIVYHIECPLPRKGKCALLLGGYFNISTLCPACGIINVGNSRYAHVEQPVDLNLVDVVALSNIAGVIEKVRR